jgi:membrane protein YdbS with pleckstrin-like domain
MINAQKEIHVAHINIRQSIFLLLLKLLSVEAFAALFIFIFFIVFFSSGFIQAIQQSCKYFFLAFFFFLVMIKSGITIYIIFQWLNEYYEISPTHIVHRSGIFMRKEQEYKIGEVAFMEVNQKFFGKLLNYGNISLLNIRRFPYINMYLIHNPLRYAQIIRDLNPGISENNILFATNITDVDED